jgi:DNA-binding MarR family transcriptional regulator/N-acetylglutamate synthase-like GNAT family acetyltransferase
MQAPPLPQSAGRLRHFNRFYTRQIGLLDRELLGSGRSLTEARVLYELAHSDRLTASDFIWKLGIDGGYLSRMLSGFEKEGLIERRPSQTDKRVSHLVLTGNGRAAFAALDGLSQTAAEALLRPLSEHRRERLLAAMADIEAALDAKEPEEEAVTLRAHRAGDIGWIVHRQAVLYAEEYGWDNSYEALVAEITAKFLQNFKPGREYCWVAERGGAILGSVFLVEASPEIAKLRLLYVEPAARGEGLGRRLVNECIVFARAKDYSRLELWTNSVLTSARRIYQAAGFQLIDEAPHHSFGQDLIGQTWALDLGASAGS